MYCRGCRKEFDTYISPICPFCGVDSRNPIECIYSEAERFLIKNSNLYEELLLNLDSTLFLIEIKNYEENLKDVEYHHETYSSFNPLYDYFKYLQRYDLCNLKYDFVKNELKRNFPNSEISNGVVERVLYMALESIVDTQRYEILKIQYYRNDSNSLPYKIEGKLWDLRIKLKRIKEETVKQWKLENNIED